MYYQIVFEDLIQNREKCATEKVVKELVDKYEKWDLSKFLSSKLSHFTTNSTTNMQSQLAGLCYNLHS